MHEVSRHECLPNPDVVLPATEVGADTPQVESVHDPGQLCPHVVRILQRSVVDEVVVTPLHVLVV